MKPGHYSILEFVHPDFDLITGHAGLQFAPTSGLATVEDDAAVRQSILLLLSTAPGERVMRPDYGCDLRRLLFEPNDDTTAGLAIHFVRKALERWEPRAEIVRLDAGRAKANLDPDALDRRKREMGAKSETSRPGAAECGLSLLGEDDPARLVIELEYRVRATQRLEQLSISLNLRGEEV